MLHKIDLKNHWNFLEVFGTTGETFVTILLSRTHFCYKGMLKKVNYVMFWFLTLYEYIICSEFK